LTEINGNPDRMTDREWENRVLCSDESCIGVIGPDGRCKVCGLAYDGELPAVTPAENIADEAVSDEMQERQEEMAVQSDVSDENEGTGGEDEWENRTLCSDESCIGVIGSDGLCKECGKPNKG